MRRSTLLLALIGTGLAVGLGFAGQQFLLSTADDVEEPARGSSSRVAPSPPEKASPTAQSDEEPDRFEKLTVIEARTLERYNGQSWVPVEVGTSLSVTDRIRNLGAGLVKLETGDGSRIELVDEVEVSVEALTRSLAELELHRGRLRADLSSDSKVAIRVTSSGASAEARAGAFVVFADGAGMVAVASETAQVKLRAQDREVLVAAGQQSLVQPDSPPTDPEAIPEEVFLKVAWPRQRSQREKRLVVRGKVAPGTEVRVGEQAAVVDPEGGFSAQIPLEEGANVVVVKARDITGRVRAEESPRVFVKNRPPRLDVVSQGQWDHLGSE